MIFSSFHEKLIFRSSNGYCWQSKVYWCSSLNRKNLLVHLQSAISEPWKYQFKEENHPPEWNILCLWHDWKKFKSFQSCMTDVLGYRFQQNLGAAPKTQKDVIVIFEELLLALKMYWFCGYLVVVIYLLSKKVIIK